MKDTLTIIAEEFNNKKSTYWEYIKRKVPASLQEDLMQELMLVLFEDQEKLIRGYNEKWLNYYFFNILLKMFYSKTSPFYKKFKKGSMPDIGEFEESFVEDKMTDSNEDLEYKLIKEDQYNKVNDALAKTKFTWYENELYKLYYLQNKTTREIAKEYDIDHVGIWKNIQSLTNKIKVNIDDYIEPNKKHRTRI